MKGPQRALSSVARGPGLVPPCLAIHPRGLGSNPQPVHRILAFFAALRKQSAMFPRHRRKRFRPPHRVEIGSTVYADEAAPWDLHARFLTKRVKHSIAYSENGASTNQAESGFSRMRRAGIGIHHHIAGAYLHAYSSEKAWGRTTGAAATESFT